MKVHLYNTMTRKVEEFKPITAGKVGLYTCGLTVYGRGHVGNLRTFLFEDILRRVLEHFGYEVNHIQNITDVGHLVGDSDSGEDKMSVGAKAEGLDAWGVAKKFTDIYFEDVKKLNMLPANEYPKATDHIPEQIDMIQKLEGNGLTYTTSDGVYFDTSKIHDYGKLSRVKIKKLKAGKRVDIGEKKNITDFALWKFSPKDQKRDMEWDSPWGKGFPGWHIECSAMSKKFLGNHFDIHCGGEDHIHVHHPNEIAQTEGATGKKPWVNYWMHCAFLQLKDEKMSKSKGGTFTIADVEDKGIDPLAYRYFCMTALYRRPLNFTWEALKGAENTLDRLREHVLSLKTDTVELTGKSVQYHEKYEEALINDLNMPQALAVLWEVVRDGTLEAAQKYSLIIHFDKILGLRLDTLQEVVVPPDIQELLEKREVARASKDWAASDTLRDEIVAKGYIIMDSADGQRVKKT
jgi:cysteinyl-tRNA synthetase